MCLHFLLAFDFMKLKLKQVEALTVSNVNSFVGSVCDALVSTAENLQPKRKLNAKRKCKHMWTLESIFPS
jgi:hypothetical protein